MNPVQAEGNRRALIRAASKTAVLLVSGCASRQRGGSAVSQNKHCVFHFFLDRAIKLYLSGEEIRPCCYLPDNSHYNNNKKFL